MEISSSSLKFRISIIEIERLRPHEETVEDIIRSLANEMNMKGRVKDPIMVDSEELVILDGMHRFSALRRLDCQYAPCCLLDYDSPKIGVGAWFRIFKVEEPEKLTEKTLADLGLHYSKLSRNLADTPSPETVILTGSGSHFSLSQSSSPLDVARTAVRLERAMVQDGNQVDYASETTSLDLLRDGRVNLVISVPVFTKKQIRDSGLQGSLLPHKVTRHIIPSRPLHLDVPLEMLKVHGLPQAEADRRLGKFLARRRVDRLPPGSVVDGRRYQEELLVFSG